jgi:hypothetical protein
LILQASFISYGEDGIQAAMFCVGYPAGVIVEVNPEVTPRRADRVNLVIKELRDGSGVVAVANTCCGWIRDSAVCGLIHSAV